jgi:hypothetical protein
MQKWEFHWQQASKKERKKERKGWMNMKVVWMNYGKYEITYY